MSPPAALCFCTKTKLREDTPEKAACQCCKMKWSSFISAEPSLSEELIAQESKSLIHHCQLLATTSSQAILPKLVGLFWQHTASNMLSLQVGICHRSAQKPQVVFCYCHQSKVLLINTSPSLRFDMKLPKKTQSKTMFNTDGSLLRLPT